MYVTRLVSLLAQISPQPRHLCRARAVRRTLVIVQSLEPLAFVGQFLLERQHRPLHLLEAALLVGAAERQRQRAAAVDSRRIYRRRHGTSSPCQGHVRYVQAPSLCRYLWQSAV